MPPTSRSDPELPISSLASLSELEDSPQAKKSRQAITLEQKIKVLEAQQRENGASSVGVNLDCWRALVNKDVNLTFPPNVTSLIHYIIKNAIANIALAWKSVPETGLNGVWHNLWPEVVHDFKGFDEGKDVKGIMKLIKEVRGDSGFQEIQEEGVTKLLVSMEDPLTSEEVLEMAEMVKKHEEEEEATDKPQTVGKELTIPKLRKFMQLVISATQSALQHDPDMELSMKVVEALTRVASTYSRLLDQLIMAQQQKKITSFFCPLSSSGEFVMKLCVMKLSINRLEN
ncbi:Tigger transposable element-derived protein 1-like 144 [Homarus americanus]|uniref:Tigger transposable element-derived protein 1-like 144 n=1 Tax=Homarus americanus TaxID=6706 RepID=A0A8J5K2I0_HOMAM|nr:Tigger transposable element-derived protein 1-like 144 [Homarus americanus]